MSQLTPEEKNAKLAHDKDVAECNKLIAEFMGFYVTVFNGSYYFVCKEEKKPEQLNQVREFRLQEAKYLSSWDWLMPVVEKIEEEGVSVTLRYGCCSIDANRDNPHNIKIVKFSPIKIMATYKAIVVFINWYNANIKNS